MTHVPAKVGQAFDGITDQGVSPDSDGDGIPDQAETSGGAPKAASSTAPSPDSPTQTGTV